MHLVQFIIQTNKFTTLIIFITLTTLKDKIPWRWCGCI